MTAAGEWLAAHAGGAPPELLDAMLGALPRSGGAVPEELAAAALGLLRTVLGGSGGREDALPLLAADALLTHAFHAQAEFAPERLAEFADRLGAGGELGGLLQPASGS